MITTPAYRLMEAADHFINPTTAPNQLWQTDFTYFKVKQWGWYYLSTVLDDYSRFILAWDRTAARVCSGMQATDVERTLQKALQAGGLPNDKRPRLLSDNGSAYVSHYLKGYLKQQGIEHVRSAAAADRTASPDDAGKN